MGKLTAFFGRVLVALLFVLGGFEKLQSFNPKTGGPAMAMMEPKLDHFIEVVQNATNIEVPIEKEHYPYLLLTASVLELGGGLLFIFGSTLGASMMMLFLVGVSPIMHNFWDLPPGSNDQMEDMIAFMKNLSILGGLLAYIAKPNPKVKVD